MGAFTNNQDQSDRRLNGVHLVLSFTAALAAAFALGWAAAAAATPSIDAPPTPSTGPESHQTDTTEAPVSTRPFSSLAEANRPFAAAVAAPDEEIPPLTRAATQQRVDEMSPLAWLASYGPVTIRHAR